MKSFGLVAFVAITLLDLLCSAATPYPAVDLSLRQVPHTKNCKPKANPPSSFICGEPGSLKNPPDPEFEPSDPITVDVATCADWCFDRNSIRHHTERSEDFPRCLGFSHDSNTNLCVSFQGLPQNSEFKKNASSTSIFYTLECFECSQSCPIPTTDTTNLLHNGGFETSSTDIGPWHTDDTNSRIVSPGHHSANALTIEIDGEILQFRGLCKGQNYLLSLDYKVDQLQSDPELGGNIAGQVSGGLGGCGFESRLVLNQSNFGTWQTIKCSFIASALDTMVISFSTVKTTTGMPVLQGFFDNVIVKPIAAPRTFQTVGPSLLLNGGFETGLLAPWTTDATVRHTSFTVTSPGLPGEMGAPRSNFKFQYQGIDIYGYHYAESSGSFQISQNTTQATEIDKLYVVSFEYRAFNSSAFEASVNDYSFFQGLDSMEQGITNKTTFVSRIFQGSGKIEQLVIEFIAHEPNKERRHQHVFLDNISILELAAGATG